MPRRDSPILDVEPHILDVDADTVLSRHSDEREPL